METGRDHVRFGRVGREYVSAPPTSPEEPYEYVGAVERLAATIEAGSPSRAGGRRGAHVVAVCNAIEAAAGARGQSSSTTAERPPTRRRRRSSDRRRPPRATRDARARRAGRCRDPAPRGRIRLLALPRRRVRRPSRLDRDRARRRVPPPRLRRAVRERTPDRGAARRAGRAGPRARVPPRKGVAYQSPPRTPARRLRWQPRGAGDRRVRLLRAPLAVGARTPGRAESSRREAG